MVGGKVLETVALRDRVWVNCYDQRQECAIYVERTPEAMSIREGDSLWWQGGFAMWTPKGNPPPFSDYRLKRIGYSGVKLHPGPDFT